MRDDVLMGRLSSIEKTLANLYRKNVFLETRVRAYETVFSSLLSKIRGLLDGAWMKFEVDRVHGDLLVKHDEDVKKRQEALKKPKLTVVNPNGLVKV